MWLRTTPARRSTPSATWWTPRVSEGRKAILVTLDESKPDTPRVSATGSGKARIGADCGRDDGLAPSGFTAEREIRGSVQWPEGEVAR